MIIEPIQRDKHQRLAFSCGHESLDRFLYESAHQAVAKGLSRTYIAVSESDETQILGYYTVATIQIEAGEMPEKLLRKFKLPRRSGLPAALIGRLAVSKQYQKQGVGSFLIFDAMTRCARVASDIGGVAIVDDALEEPVVNWYGSFGIIRFSQTSLRMFILVSKVREVLIGLTPEN